MKGRSAAFANGVVYELREDRGVGDCSWLNINRWPAEGNEKSERAKAVVCDAESGGQCFLPAPRCAAGNSPRSWPTSVQNARGGRWAHARRMVPGLRRKGPKPDSRPQAAWIKSVATSGLKLAGF